MTRRADRCAHGTPGGCSRCAAFTASVVASVADLRTWKAGALADLNRKSEAAR